MVGTFPDGNSALMLVCARLRHVAATQWGNKKYMDMKHLEAALEDVSIACCPHSAGVCKPILRITLDLLTKAPKTPFLCYNRNEEG